MNLLAISPNVFGTGLTWYSVFVLLGAIVTYVITEYFYKKNEESKKCPDLVLNTFLIAFPSGLLGARIWYILSELEYYISDPISMLKVWEGGLAIQGGVVLGAIVGIVFAKHMIRKHGMNFKITTLMDMAIPNILIAQVIGRWGNFFNREVYGACVSKSYTYTHWWMLPDWLTGYMKGGFISDQYIACSTREYAQPLFLYEGILNLVGFILISIVIRKLFSKRIDGTLTAFYLIWYGVVRACLEPLRNEMFIMRWGKISQSVVTSIIFIVLGIIYLSYLYIKNYKELACKKMCDSVEEKEALSDTNITKEEKVEDEVLVKKAPVKRTTKKNDTSLNKETMTKSGNKPTRKKTTKVDKE